MLYISQFDFPDEQAEWRFLSSPKLPDCYDTTYPFQFLSSRHCESVEFKPITIFYGGNGSGKSTVLNVVGARALITREARFNQSGLFQAYVDMCRVSITHPVPPHSRMITSDDVFDYILHVRSVNDGVTQRREELQQEYLQNYWNPPTGFNSLEDFKTLKAICDARRQTSSQYVRHRLAKNIREYSNGEQAFLYFSDKIQDNGLYLLDEPENSLSPERQIELARFLEDSVRFYGCQLILATHSPFLLAIPGARIYNLDQNPVVVERWTELENVRTFYNFFQSHAADFE